MSLRDDLEEYFDALERIESAADGASEAQQRVGEEHTARLTAAETELRGVRDLRRRADTRLRAVAGRLDSAGVDNGPWERAPDPPAVTSLDDAIRLINHYDAELSQTVTNLETARGARRGRRWVVAAVFVAVLGPLGVFLAGGTPLFVGGCAVAMVVLFLSRGVAHARAFILPLGCAVLCIVIAYFGWAWWQVLIGVLVFLVVAGAIMQGAERVQAAMRRDGS